MIAATEYMCAAEDLIARARGFSMDLSNPDCPDYDSLLGLLIDISNHLERGRIVVLQSNAGGLELRAYE